jgi:ComF family protein
MHPERSIASWFEGVLSLVYPTVCVLCHRQRADHRQGYVCETCSLSVRRIGDHCCQRCGLPWSGKIVGPHACESCRGASGSWDEARAAVIAEGVALDCIHRLKYRKEPWFATFLSGLLNEAAVPALKEGSWQGIVPVPLHRAKLREREFNQAERLAGPLARALDVPMVTDRVRRREPTASQASLSRDDRSRNVRSAFEAARTDRIRGSWIIVDDVLTTGATTDAVAAVLKGLGAEQVVVWAVARAVLEPGGVWTDPPQPALPITSRAPGS